jgi:hypothetical protein
MVAAAVGAAALVGGVYAANSSASAAQDAADTQAQSAQQGIAANQAQFAAVQKLLAPYVSAGTSALTAQGNLAGINGNDAQAAAISALQSSPQYTALLKSGENSILQNASATGGLRGGNTQGALAQFSPALLAQTINDQYNKLGGLTSVGQNAAAGVGNSGNASTAAITNLLQQQGAATAGGYLAQGAANAGYANSISSAVGAYGSLGGFESSGVSQSSVDAYNDLGNVTF